MVEDHKEGLNVCWPFVKVGNLLQSFPHETDHLTDIYFFSFRHLACGGSSLDLPIRRRNICCRWFSEGRVTSVGVVQTDKPFSNWLANEAFKDFEISENQLEGFPFFCVFGQGDVRLRAPLTAFSKDNFDYLYRLACRGTAEDFQALKLSSKALLQSTEDQDLTLMHAAALYGNVSVLHFLVEAGADKVRIRTESPIIRYAVMGGKIEAAEFLVGIGHSATQSTKTKGADLTFKVGPHGSSLMHLAAEKGFPQIIQALAIAGMNINALDKRGMTPLYISVLTKQVNSVHELLGLGADPNMKPEKRPAAVWMAVVQDERESIQSLIQFGAKCELDDTLAMQLMEYALAFDIPEVSSGVG